MFSLSSDPPTPGFSLSHSEVSHWSGDSSRRCVTLIWLDGRCSVVTNRSTVAATSACHHPSPAPAPPWPASDWLNYARTHSDADDVHRINAGDKFSWKLFVKMIFKMGRRLNCNRWRCWVYWGFFMLKWVKNETFRVSKVSSVTDAEGGGCSCFWAHYANCYLNVCKQKVQDVTVVVSDVSITAWSGNSLASTFYGSKMQKLSVLNY